MAIQFITGNKTKFKEVESLLKPVHIQQLKIDLDEIQDIDPHKIIRHKLKEAFRHHKGPFIIEDDSVNFECLGGRLPGPFIKWFNDYLGIEGMAKLAMKTGEKGATALALIAYAKNSREIVFFEGRVKGKIVSPRGQYKFGYDEIFKPKGSNQTFSQMKAKSDFTKSPRGAAAGRLKRYLLST